MRRLFSHISTANQGGFTLLEVLIAVLVLSIGLLGLAGMQIIGLRNNQSAYLRTIATLHAYDIADRIRANEEGEKAGNYDSPNPTVPTGSTPVPNCITSDCTTSANVAAYDLSEWKINIRDALPEGRGTIDEDDDIYEITVMWDDDRTGVTGNPVCGTNITCTTVFFEP